MERQRALFVLMVELDPVPGTFHNLQSAKESIEQILMDRIPHYKPTIIFEQRELKT